MCCDDELQTFLANTKLIWLENVQRSIRIQGEWTLVNGY